MTQISSNSGTKNINGLPNNCPHCHNSVTPNAIFGYQALGTLEVMLACPNEDCQKAFIGHYDYNLDGQRNWHFNGKVSQGTVRGKSFSEAINGISSGFVRIYNQSYHAEQIELNEICGVGYRKALEFLIKDYAKTKQPDQSIKIEAKLLGPCIKDYVVDERIQKVAKRAVWLGNDETHYVRKWGEKDLTDLKKLIDLTVHWIEMEILTEEIEADMPE